MLQAAAQATATPALSDKPAGDVQMTNQALGDLLGYTRNELMGHNVNVIIPP